MSKDRQEFPDKLTVTIELINTDDWADWEHEPNPQKVIDHLEHDIKTSVKRLGVDIGKINIEINELNKEK